MNISQTQDLLSWLWSKFPNGKTLSAEDKRSTVVAYFDELWQYSLEDVIAGARKALAAQPHFVPSAPEIAHYCTKTIDYQKYLPREYAQLSDRLEQARKLRDSQKDEYRKAFAARDEIMREFGRVQFCDKEKQAAHNAECREKCAPFDAVLERYSAIEEECKALLRQCDAMCGTAMQNALQAYETAQRKLAAPDLKFLGIPQPQLALEG